MVFISYNELQTIRLKCKSCQEVFTSKAKRAVHVRIFHQNEAICAFPITTTTSPDCTTEVHTVKRIRGVFSCPKCPKHFQDPNSLRRHTQRCSSQRKSLQHLTKMVPHITSLDGPLVDLGLLYDAKIGILVCAICRYGLLGTAIQVQRHISQVHKHTIPLETLEDRFQNLNLAGETDLIRFLDPSSTPYPPIGFIPVKQGFSCKHCTYFVTKLGSIMKHYKEKHTGVQAEFDTCKVQSLYCGPQQKYYRVDEPQSNQEQSCATLIEQAVDWFNSNVNLLVPPSHEIQLSAFSRTFRWHETLKTHCRIDPEAIVSGMKFDRQNEIVLQIYPVLCRYWQISQNLIGTQEYLLEVILSGSGSSMNSSSSFSRLQSSGEKYCQQLMSMLLMVKWQSDFPNAIPGIKYPNDLLKRFDALLLVPHCDRHHLTTFRNLSEKDCGFQKLSALHSVLTCIYHVNLNDKHAPDAFLTFVTHRFLVLSAIKSFEKDSDGFVQFRKPGKITSFVAVLKFWARQVTLMELHKRTWGIAATENNPITQTRAILLQQFLRSGERTPYGSMEEVMRLGSSIAMAPEQKDMPQLAWLSPNFDKASLGGIVVSITDIVAMVRRLTNELRSIMQAKILRGLDISFIRQLLQQSASSLYDNYQDICSGYSFLDDPRNKLKSRRMDLVSYLLQTFQKEFIMSSTENGMFLNIRKVQQWCKYVDKVTALWIPLIHITAGQPSRASELGAMLLRNTVSGARNLYFHGSKFMIVQRYHKGSSMSGQHRLLARFLPDSFTLDFMVYLLYVRPALEFFMRYFPYGERCGTVKKQFHDCHYCLWTNHDGGKIDSDRMSEIINNSFLRSNLEITVSTYRHFAVGLKDKHLSTTKIISDMYDLQAAHSTKVASRLYSRPTTDPSFMSRDDMYEYLRCSLEWQNLLGFRENHTDDLLDLNNASNADPRNSVCARAEEISNLQLSQVPNQHPVQFAQKLLFSDVQDVRNLALATPIMIPPFRHPTLQQALLRITPEQYFKSQKVLQNFFNDYQARYRTTEQSIAATLVLEGVVNLLVVLPTNGGKSLLYQIPAFADPESTTIVIIPLVALLLESVQKCEALGINCASYNPDMDPHVTTYSLIFVGVDYLSHPKFREFTSSLYNRGTLKRIFFDEAHLVLTARTYRSSMASAKLLAVLDVQKILLTATLPPSWECDLSSGFGFEFATIRLPTIRSEIIYSVQEVNSISQMVQTCIDLVNELLVHPNKGIVFVMTKREVESTLAILKQNSDQTFAIYMYHSDLTIEERREQLHLWKSHKANFIIATSGLGQGVDYRQVRVVIHIGLAHSLVDYAQETGRAGRDGRPARCITTYSKIYSSTFMKKISTGTEDAHRRKDQNESHNIEEVDKFFRSKGHCRRQLLQIALDGSGFPCTAYGTQNLCDVCSQSNFSDDTVLVHAQRIESERIRERSAIGITSSVALARRDQLDDGIIYNTLKQFLTHEVSYCVVCWVTSKTTMRVHEPSQCPYQVNSCFKCLGNHRASSCPNAPRYPEFTCYICGLPLIDAYQKESLHYGVESGTICTTRARGVMIPGVWRFFREIKRRNNVTAPLEMQIISFREREFADWLVRASPSGSMSNLCRLWSYILMD